MSDLILYTTEDGKSQLQLQLRSDVGTVWLTQLEMAELFWMQIQLSRNP